MLSRGQRVDVARAGDLAGGADATDEAAFEEILRILARRFGIDVGAYRPAMIRRRLDGRMRLAGFDGLAPYLAHLRTDREEQARLLAHLTIKVTRFYRNGRSFGRLRPVLRELLARRGNLRVWSAGCSTGEEAWTLAMLLEEAGAPVDEKSPQVQATDVDESALEVARLRRYPVRAAVELPEPLSERFVLRHGEEAPYLKVAPTLARRVEFRLHDLVSAVEPPLGWTFDLVVCRNVLIYVEERQRHRALSLIVRSLSPGGYLLLGEAEWPEPRPENAPLRVVDRKARLFQRPLRQEEDPRP